MTGIMRNPLTFLVFFVVIALPFGEQALGAPPGESVTITEQVQLDFAQLNTPASGSETIIINPTTGGFSGSGTVQIGTPARGQYKIKLTGNGSTTSATIDVQNISSGSGAVTISNFTADYGGSAIGALPQSGLAKPAKGQGTVLYLGATAQYTSAVPAGTLTPTFDIVVTLQ